jgi:hypothetical protein
MATYKLIQSATVGSGGASGIVFTSIPATYTDLLLFISIRNDNSGTDATRTVLRFNGLTTDTNMSFLRLGGNGSGVFSDTGSQGHITWHPDNGSTANTFSNTEVYIPNYAGSNQKTFAATGGNEKNIASTAYQGIFALNWADTSPITSIRIFPEIAYNLVQYSTAYLYGISNA